jgi:hypothetical protein
MPVRILLGLNLFLDNPCGGAMAVLQLKRAWRIKKMDKEYRLNLILTNRGTHTLFEVLVDDQKMIEKKESNLNDLWGDYEVNLDGSLLVLRVFKKGILGLATEVELYHNDQLIPQESLYSLPSIVDQPEKDLRNVPSSERPEAMIPKLPPKCGACGAPVSMQNVEWVGPLNAQCSRCSSAIDVEWQKLG